MTGFPINPPRAPIADGAGNTTPEWYRFFVQIQRMIGGPSDPFDDASMLAMTPVNAGAFAGADDLAPPSLNISAEDVLAAPVHAAQFDDLLQPYPMPAPPADGRVGYRTLTASANAEIWDRVILVDTTAGAVTVTLPAVAACAGLVLNIKKIDAAANNMVIDGNGAETIDGAANITTATQWASYTVLATAAGWMIL